MSPRGLEPRTFCVLGRCDDHYTMVTENVKLFRSSQNTLINTVFYKISVSDNREPFDHWKISPRGLEPRTFSVLGRCDGHYAMVMKMMTTTPWFTLLTLQIILDDSDKYGFFLQDISLWYLRTFRTFKNVTTRARTADFLRVRQMWWPLRHGDSQC